MSDLAAQFEQDMRRDSALYTRKVRSSPSRYLQMIKEIGGVETTKRLGGSMAIHDGFTNAILAGCPELTVEYLMVYGENGRYNSLFTEDELANARKKLT